MAIDSTAPKSISVSLGGKNPYSIKAGVEFITAFKDWVNEIKAVYPTTNINALLRSAVWLLMTDPHFSSKAINHSLDIASPSKSHTRPPNLVLPSGEPMQDAA